ncbi:MAG: polysaccharide deacetylase family protein [Bacteroidota bacterium]
MIYRYRTPWIVRKWYRSFEWSIPSDNSIYLTFDDGPHPYITPWVLDKLSKYDANATFFSLGKQIIKHPRLIEETITSGHAIGNHTYNHVRGWNTNSVDYLNEVEKCDLEHIICVAQFH